MDSSVIEVLKRIFHTQRQLILASFFILPLTISHCLPRLKDFFLSLCRTVNI